VIHVTVSCFARLFSVGFSRTDSGGPIRDKTNLPVMRALLFSDSLNSAFRPGRMKGRDAGTTSSEMSLEASFTVEPGFRRAHLVELADCKPLNQTEAPPISGLSGDKDFSFSKLLQNINSRMIRSLSHHLCKNI
jgi:hypothetical protein